MIFIVMTENRNNLFPVFLKIESLKTLIVGGGNVGLEKLTALLKSSPAISATVVASRILPEIKSIAAENRRINVKEKPFEESDLDGHDIVFLATDDRSLHEDIRRMARGRRLLLNVADTPDLCDFYLGSVVTKGNLKIAISTNGKSPTIARRMREYLDEAIPDSVDDLLHNMNRIRDRIKGDLREKIRRLNEVTSSWVRKPDDEGSAR